MSFAACLRLSFSGFRVRSTAVFLGRLRRKCIRPQAVFLDYACEAPAFAAASQSCTASVSRIREGRGNVPAGGYLLCSFSPPRYLSSVRLSSALEPVWAYVASSTCWKVTATTTLAQMLMYGKEASNRKQEIDRQHYTIPNQRPKDKHCGKI